MSRARLRRAAAVCCAVGALLLLSSPLAFAGTSGGLAGDIADEVMCVTCRVPLNVAVGAQADRERAYIRDLVRKKQSKAQIKSALVDNYGRTVLIPVAASTGPGLAVYVVLVLVGLGLLAAYTAKRLHRRTGVSR